MRVRLHFLNGSPIRRSLNLPGVPQVGDILWADTDPNQPSLTKLYVHRVEWFERYDGDTPGVVVTCSGAP